MTCGSNPVSVAANSVNNIGEGNNFTGNSIDRIEVRAETITSSTVWRYTGIPYQTTGGISVYGSSLPHLSIQSGTIVMFPNGAGLTLGSTSSPSIRGSLEATNVTFTRSDETAITAGIRYNNNLEEAQCVLTNCLIEYARDAGTNAAIYVNNTSPQFIGCTISNCPGDGIVGTGAANFSVTDCLISNCNGYPIKTSATAFAAVSGVGNQFTGNNPNRILISGALIATDQEWSNPGIPIEITSNISVYNTTLPILRINSGLNLLFRSGTGIAFGTTGSPSSRGGLQAIGASFSALSGIQGDWNGIQFSSYCRSDSYIENCTVLHATSNVYLNNCQIERIEGCIIQQGNYGIRLTGSLAGTLIARNFIRNNTIGIHCSGNANPTIGADLGNANSITGNTGYGLQNTSGLTIDATYNWWGDADGPTLRFGDAITGNINYIPWRTSTIGDAPARFHLLLPLHASVVASNQPLLDWEDAVDPTPDDVVSYYLMISTTPDYLPGTVMTIEPLLSSLYLFPDGTLADDTRYFWKVNAGDNQGQFTACYEQNRYFDLAIPQAPNDFSIDMPAYDESVFLTSNKLVWQEATDPDPGDFISYRVYIDITAGFEDPDYVDTDLTYAWTPFCEPGALYYWKVRAMDTTGRETWSPTSRFYVDLDARPRPPVDFDLSWDGSDLVLTWDNVPGADAYEIYQSPDPVIPYNLLGTSPQPTFRHINALSQGQSFYYIKAIDGIQRRFRN